MTEPATHSDRLIIAQLLELYDGDGMPHDELPDFDQEGIDEWEEIFVPRPALREALRRLQDGSERRDEARAELERLRAALRTIAAVRLESGPDTIWAPLPVAEFAREALGETE